MTDAHATNQGETETMTETLTTRDGIERRINEVLIEFGVEPGASRLDATWEEIDVDSLDLAELAQILEDEYGVELRRRDMVEMKTVGDAVEMVSARLA
jgi:acyl carrier protein